jgi:hypothetical protein
VGLGLFADPSTGWLTVSRELKRFAFDVDGMGLAVVALFPMLSVDPLVVTRLLLFPTAGILPTGRGRWMWHLEGSHARVQVRISPDPGPLHRSIVLLSLLPELSHLLIVSLNLLLVLPIHLLQLVFILLHLRLLLLVDKGE